MNIRSSRAVRKTAETALSRQEDPSSHAVRWIRTRYDVSPSLARTIAGLAMLGGAQ